MTMQVIRNNKFKPNVFRPNVFRNAAIAFVVPAHTWVTIVRPEAKDGKWPDS